jgi:hypothetical protein
VSRCVMDAEAVPDFPYGENIQTACGRVR